MTTGSAEPDPRRPGPLKIFYLVPDLTDPAVKRRVEMLRAGGAVVQVAGFHRKPWIVPVDGYAPLGQTEDANLRQRVRAIAGWLLKPWALARLARDRDVILARNLEMLLLARVVRLLRGERPGLVYECLDVHSIMLGQGLATRALRAIESALLKSSKAIIVSSPAFTTGYFDRVHPHHPPAILVENKWLGLLPLPAPSSHRRASGHPWRIGWFGMIRCRKSLDLLKALTVSRPGQVQVTIRGRPTAAVFPDFAQALAGYPDISFEGPYAPADLPDHYGNVDFVWGMDFYEAGQNSSWLLPNRLYEGGAFNVPTLAQADVETARWLETVDSGVIFDDPATQLAPFFAGLSEIDYAALRRRAQAVPRAKLICDEEACRTLVDSLRP